jgi:addiction module HigA family antidote
MRHSHRQLSARPKSANKGDAFAPVTPGEMLRHEFLKEYGLSQNQLANAIGISPKHISEIVNNRRCIVTDTAVRFAGFFGNSPEFWTNLQTNYDLRHSANTHSRPSS